MLELMAEGVNFADHQSDGGWPNRVSVYIYSIYIHLTALKRNIRTEGIVTLFMIVASLQQLLNIQALYRMLNSWSLAVAGGYSLLPPKCYEYQVCPLISPVLSRRIYSRI